MKIFILAIIPLLHAHCPDIPREQCQPCPPCARVPKALIYGGKVRKIQSSIAKEMIQKKKFRHFSTDLNEEQRLMIIRDTDEVFNSQTIDLSNYPSKMVKHPWRKEGEVDEENTTKRPASTIPTATPHVPTKAPRMWMKFTKYMKKRKIPRVTSTTPSTTTAQSETSTTVLQSTTKTLLVNTTNSSITPLNKTAEEVPVVPTGYKTNPNFSPDEVPIEDEKCNDLELQKILIEGMRIDDSVMSKRSIGAILSSTKRNYISVLCSDQEVAFRLVARKHCQLSAGKATCVLFVL